MKLDSRNALRVKQINPSQGVGIFDVHPGKSNRDFAAICRLLQVCKAIVLQGSETIARFGYLPSHNRTHSSWVSQQESLSLPLYASKPLFLVYNLH